MSLAEIEAAAEALPREQKEELLRFLAGQLRSRVTPSHKARLVSRDGDILLEAPAGAPLMTPENVKRMLEDWP